MTMQTTASDQRVLPATGRDLLLQTVLSLPRAARLTVLIYHRVMAAFDPLRPQEPTGDEFEARMRWVAANFEVLPLDEAAAAVGRGKLPRNAACITFDDGYADNHDVAMPVLRRLGLPATFFVAVGYLDGGCMFNDVVIEAVRQAQGATLDLAELGLGRHSILGVEDRRRTIATILDQVKYFEPARREQIAMRILALAGAVLPSDLMMTSDQVAGLHAAGMQIGAHTVTHPILAEVPIEVARDEIARGRARLEEITGAPVRVFAYPNGRPLRDYRREHAQLVRELGFQAAVSTAWGAARAGDDVFQIPRFTPWDKSSWRFGLRLARNLLGNDYVHA